MPTVRGIDHLPLVGDAHPTNAAIIADLRIKLCCAQVDRILCQVPWRVNRNTGLFRRFFRNDATRGRLGLLRLFGAGQELLQVLALAKLNRADGDIHFDLLVPLT